MSHKGSVSVAHDPSVGADADTSPAKLGRLHVSNHVVKSWIGARSVIRLLGISSGSA